MLFDCTALLDKSKCVVHSFSCPSVLQAFIICHVPFIYHQTPTLPNVSTLCRNRDVHGNEWLNLLYSKKRWLTDDPLTVSFLDTHWVQLGRGLMFSILPFHLGARMPQITQRIQTKSHCPFRQWLPFSVISLRPSSGTAIIPTKTSERGVERWQTTNIHLRTGSKLYQTNN